MSRRPQGDAFTIDGTEGRDFQDDVGRTGAKHILYFSKWVGAWAAGTKSGKGVCADIQELPKKGII